MCIYCNTKHKSDKVVDEYYDPLKCECGHAIFQHNYEHPHTCMYHPKYHDRDSHCNEFKLLREYKMQVQL